MAQYKFHGRIKVTSSDGRSCVVILDKPVADKLYAVISTETQGRVKLLNGKGLLEINKPVHGEAKLGGDALLAVSVYAD
ncbi:MAG: hypothetical protein JWO45_1608 [Spartobacteria bacterium]|nr:hypothetical protein [Spartobacteria bacterium]